MSYIEQSITGNEKVLVIGRFHWIYMAGALFWLIFGLIGCLIVLGFGMWWKVHSGMNILYPNLPAHMFWQGWSAVVEAQGGYVTAIRDINTYVRLGAFGFLVLGMLLFAHMMVIRATTEIAVTTQRLVIKEGVIARHVDEMNIDRIESVHVTQSVLGRMLNFGTVMVRGMGVGEIVLPPLAEPVNFRNAIERARETQVERRHG